MPPWVVLAAAVAAISFGGPLSRLAHAHPLAIAVWRLGLSLLAVGGFLLTSQGWRQWRTLTTAELLAAAAGGVFLALHFWTWIASLTMTTVAASVVLVNVQPVIVALLSAAFLHERPVRRQWIGIGIAVGGAVIVAGPDLLTAGGASPRALFGDLLALIGALTAALYFLVGRQLRRKLDLWPYVALVYGACFVSLVGFALAVDAPLAAQRPREIGIFAALAVGPMLIGHTGCNWALRYLPAYVVNVALLGELVGATILAAVLPGIREVPPPPTLIGGALILAGIIVTSKPVR
jgi:drug/metabolite transporter (DMT)-like permease